MTTEQTVSAADVYKMWLKAPKLWRCGKWTVSKVFFFGKLQSRGLFWHRQMTYLLFLFFFF